MALKTINESTLTAIANAIRAKLGVATTYKPSEMAAAIGNIQTPNLETLEVDENGTYTPTAPKNGFSQVDVNVPNSYAAGDEGKVVSNGALVAQTSKNINENGTHDTTTINQVVVSVTPNLQQKTATQNGDVTPDSGYDGLSKVVVNVSGGGSSALLTPVSKDYEGGYVGGDTFYYGASGSAFKNDIYQVVSGHRYMFGLGSTVGNRFRVLFSTTNTATATSNVSGYALIAVDTPPSYRQYDKSVPYAPNANGYITIMKTNQGTTGIKSYCLDVTEATS